MQQTIVRQMSRPPGKNPYKHKTYIIRTNNTTTFRGVYTLRATGTGSSCYSAPNARIVNLQALYHCRLRQFRLSVVRPSVTRRYCVKTTARSTVQFALSDSKMCLVL